MAEKDRKSENDASSDTLRYMRQVEDKQTSELLGHQHDVYNETAKRFKEEIDEIQERQAHGLVQHRQNLNASTILRQQKMLSSQKDEIQAEIDAEMASVLSKV